MAIRPTANLKDEGEQIMTGKFKTKQRLWLSLMIIVCIGSIFAGGIHYLESLRVNLAKQSVQNVLTVTTQQQQAFDNFISEDLERLHSFAQYFSKSGSGSALSIQHQMALFREVDAFYSVINLKNGLFCSNRFLAISHMSEGDLEEYRTLSGSGVRDSYKGLYNSETMFGYYECFSFDDGVQGIVQKSYSRSKVSDAFSLSFYNDQGFAYVVNQRGDILLRSTGIIGDHLYENIFDALTASHSDPGDISAFMSALYARESGSMTFDGDEGNLVYSYVPLENVKQWYLVSIVPEDAIMAEADEMIMASRQAVVLLMVILLVCAVFILLIWHTHREIKGKEQEIEYQIQLFNIFSTYLSQNTDDVYMMLSMSDHRLEYVSPNLERVFGIPPQQLMEQPESLETVCSVGKQLDLSQLYSLEPGAGTEAVSFEWYNPRTRERKWFQESVYRVQVQNNSKLVVYISDRTRERKAQNNLAEALRMAQAANNAKSAFLSSVSHDIRTPMNAIIGFLTLMKNEADNPGMVREYAQRIEAASQHLLGLINDVLDMNKIESGSATLSISEMNLADVIDEINTIIRPQTKDREQSFDIYVSPLTCERLRGDKLRINQVLINLLSNAVKYTPKGGHIEMRVEELPQVVENYVRIRFTVKDDGMGMSEEYQKIIFDPFTREENEITHQIQGTGLGMAITRSLVDLMGGSIKVESTLDQGSVFIVELELAVQEQEDDPRFWADRGVSRILVADDNEEICQTIAKAMERTGVETQYATDGRTAFQMLLQAREEGRPYDLILLDWKMPQLSGLETARRIRENYPDRIPILLLTAYDWSDIEQEAISTGVDHFIPKPFFLSSFKEAVRRLTEGRSRQEDDNHVVEGLHILVVDDIEVNQIILVKILTTMGAQCSVAGNGQEALDLFTNSGLGEYDLILMDVQMPVMDGYSATRAIRASGHPAAESIPIIAMTANAFVDDVRDAIDAGMDAHIAKPIQVDKLKATIQQILEGPREADIPQKGNMKL